MRRLIRQEKDMAIEEIKKEMASMQTYAGTPSEGKGEEKGWYESSRGSSGEKARPRGKGGDPWPGHKGEDGDRSWSKGKEWDHSSWGSSGSSWGSSGEKAGPRGRGGDHWSGGEAEGGGSSWSGGRSEEGRGYHPEAKPWSLWASSPEAEATKGGGGGGKGRWGKKRTWEDTESKDWETPYYWRTRESSYGKEHWEEKEAKRRKEEGWQARHQNPKNKWKTQEFAKPVWKKKEDVFPPQVPAPPAKHEQGQTPITPPPLPPPSVSPPAVDAASIAALLKDSIQASIIQAVKAEVGSYTSIGTTSTGYGGKGKSHEEEAAGGKSHGKGKAHAESLDEEGAAGGKSHGKGKAQAESLDEEEDGGKGLGKKGAGGKKGKGVWCEDVEEEEESDIGSGKSFPKLPDMADKSHETEEPLPECLICYGDDWTTKRQEGGWIELVDSVRLPCMHNPFHLQCIQQSLAEHQFCPACRFPIDPGFKQAILTASQRMEELEHNGLPHVFRRALVRPKAQPKRKSAGSSSGGDGKGGGGGKGSHHFGGNPGGASSSAKDHVAGEGHHGTAQGEGGGSSSAGAHGGSQEAMEVEDFKEEEDGHGKGKGGGGKGSHGSGDGAGGKSSSSEAHVAGEGHHGTAEGEGGESSSAGAHGSKGAGGKGTLVAGGKSFNVKEVPFDPSQWIGASDDSGDPSPGKGPGLKGAAGKGGVGGGGEAGEHTPGEESGGSPAGEGAVSAVPKEAALAPRKRARGKTAPAPAGLPKVPVTWKHAEKNQKEQFRKEIEV